MKETDVQAGLLEKSVLFSGLDRSVLRKIAGITREVDHAAGHVIVQEGSGVHAMHVIVEGNAVVTVEDTEVARLGPGDSFGEIALFDEGPRTATVAADTPLRVLAVDASAFRYMVENDGALASRLLTRLARMIRSMDSIVAECGLGTGSD
jgi:CRP-like cAMP-binding protein